ncbi:cytochrome b [Caulobacter sp. NIBR2454]|uniref:cytochrome b n=1 Tax=Caulobacter sp. NIBR2454 TaxID=3015996 RepID=UPI0022B715FE|nr:cytochrome b/b6 domain-containing protein [Caulobacter sp. NIBR2454]
MEGLKRWVKGYNRRRRYSPVGVAFHWVVAALVLFQLWWGWRTGRLPVGPDKLDAYQLHSAVGLVILVIMLLRTAWRTMMAPGPINDADAPGWQSVIAHLTHYMFYVALILLPISGWAMVSATAAEQPLRFGGVLPWPMLPFHELSLPTRWAIEMWAERIHFALVVMLVLAIPAHVGAALWHHFHYKHDVLEGMLPGVTELEEDVRKALMHKKKRRRSRLA